MSARIVPLIVLLLLALALGLGLAKAPARPKERMVGQTISMFDIPELGKPGTHFSPESWQGKTVIINIFATWCEPCKAEHGALVALSKSTKVPIYGIAWKDKETSIRQWLKTHGNPYAVVASDEVGDTTIPFSMTGIPETFIIDKSGIVRYHFNSALNEDMIHNDILPLLEELNAQ